MGDFTHAAIDQLAGNFVVGCAATPAALGEAQRLRYQVFCHERAILDGLNGSECDGFDDHSHHVIVRRRSGPMVATARVVTFRSDRPNRSFPMQLVCDPAVLADVPLETTGEISRFAISREWRRSEAQSDTLLRLALMQGILEVSRRLRLTHWCAAMEPSLLRLLRRTAINFEGVGPLIEYRGWRQPAVCAIDETLQLGRRELPAAWSYATAQGRYHGDQTRRAA